MSDRLFDFEARDLEAYLNDHIDGFGRLVSMEKFATGQSNPTFQLTASSGNYVLRAKPPGKLLKSAHQVDREYRVMKALGATDVPVPEVFHLAGEDSPMGVMFFVMDMVEGRILWDPVLPDMSNAERSAIYEQICLTIARLHSVVPADVSLADFGAPGNYFERQLSRWSRQYVASELDHKPDVHWLIDWLEEHLVPDDGQISIVHGDYRIDNLIFAQGGPEICAVLDWELSTLGHPMADIAYQAMQWRQPQGGKSKGLGDIDRKAAGIPDERDYLARYCDLRGIKEPDSWEFYLVFSYFRLIAILEGVIRRAVEGNASNPEGVEGFRQAIPVLASQAKEIASASA